MTEILRDGFDSLAAWTTIGSPAIVSGGRNGQGLDLGPTSNAEVVYAIASAQRSDTVTLGFAVRFTAFPATNNIRLISLYSNANSISEVGVLVNTNGSLSLARNPAGAVVLGTTAAGVLVVNTWHYVEFQTKVNDTTGFGTIRVDGTQVLNITGVDTKNNSATIDTLRVRNARNNGTALSQLVDDLYLMTGLGDSFLGSIIVGGATAKVWNGSAFVSAPVNVWNGSAFVGAVAVKTWNGSTFV